MGSHEKGVGVTHSGGNRSGWSENRDRAFSAFRLGNHETLSRISLSRRSFRRKCLRAAWYLRQWFITFATVSLLPQYLQEGLVVCLFVQQMLGHISCVPSRSLETKKNDLLQARLHKLHQ